MATPSSPDHLTLNIGTHPALSYVPKDADKATRDLKKRGMAIKAAHGVRNVEMTVAELAAHVDAERGFMSAMSDGHRCNESASASFLIGDDDKIGTDFVPQVEAFNAKYGYTVIIGGTATVGHHRAIVPFAGSTSDPELYQLFMKWFSAELGAEIDPASGVLSQPWLGFRKGTARILPGKLLTLDELMLLTAPLRAAEAEQVRLREERRLALEYKPIERGSDAAAQSVKRALDHAFNQLAGIPEGQNRKKAAAGQARWLATFLLNYPMTRQDIERAVLDGCYRNGALAKYGETACLDAVAWGIKHGLSDDPEPLEAPTKRPAPTRLREAPAFETIPAVSEAIKIQPLTLRQAGRMMICCPEYVVIEKHVLEMGCADSFTVNMLANSMGCSVDTADRLIKRALQCQAISPRSAEKMTIESTHSIRMNSAERQFIRGAAVARRYYLTPHLAEPNLVRGLPDRVQELMEYGDPDTIRKDEAKQAGLTEQDSAALQTITEEIARSVEAFEVSADAERAAVRKANELNWLAESDETPFAPERLPESVTDLRVLLIEALIDTAPDVEWTQAVLMWVVGVKRNSIPALIKKSRYAPAEASTFIPVALEGKNLHSAVKAKCVEKHGAPVAWLDGKDQVIASFGRAIPAGAKGVLLNIGKKYVRRAPAAIIPQDVTDEPPVIPQPEEDPAEQEARRAKVRARRNMISRQRGCMKAQGWKFVPGPFGYWERGAQTQPNTWEGMVEALLLDREWAEKQRSEREPSESLLDFAVSLGAVILELA